MAIIHRLASHAKEEEIMSKFQQRVEVAEKLDKAIDTVAKLYNELTTINASIPGSRKFDKVETIRRFKDRLAFVLADPVTHEGPLGTGRISTTIAEAVRKDHAELAAKKGA